MQKMYARTGQKKWRSLFLPPPRLFSIAQITRDLRSGSAKRPAGYWKNQDHQREFLENVASKLGITEVLPLSISRYKKVTHPYAPKINFPSLICQLDGWYSVTRREVERVGGKGPLRFVSSIEGLLKKVYPDYRWDSLRFGEMDGRVPHGYWRDPSRFLPALQTAEQAIGIQRVPLFHSHARP